MAYRIKGTNCSRTLAVDVNALASREEEKTPKPTPKSEQKTPKREREEKTQKSSEKAARREEKEESVSES